MVKWDKELYHYGIPRRSGRYPWGSGKDPYHHGKGILGKIADSVSAVANRSADRAPTLNSRRSIFDDILRSDYDKTSSTITKLHNIFSDLDISTKQVDQIEPTPTFRMYSNHALARKRTPNRIAEIKITNDKYKKYGTAGHIIGDWDRPETLRFESFAKANVDEINKLVDAWSNDDRRRSTKYANFGRNVYRYRDDRIRRLR